MSAGVELMEYVLLEGDTYTVKMDEGFSEQPPTFTVDELNGLLAAYFAGGHRQPRDYSNLPTGWYVGSGCLNWDYAFDRPAEVPLQALFDLQQMQLCVKRGGRRVYCSVYTKEWLIRFYGLREYQWDYDDPTEIGLCRSMEAFLRALEEA